MLFWQIENKAKKQTKQVKDKQSRKILIKFFTVFCFVIYSLQHQKNEKFTTYYKNKLIYFNVNEIQIVVSDIINNHKSNLLEKIIRGLKVNNDLLLNDIFTLYLKSLILYDSIENFKFFYDKNYNQKSNEISTKKFIEFLDLKIKINKKIKQIFKYKYGNIIYFINRYVGSKI